jgi:hypothetical protein
VGELVAGREDDGVEASGGDEDEAGVGALQHLGNLPRRAPSPAPTPTPPPCPATSILGFGGEGGRDPELTAGGGKCRVARAARRKHDDARRLSRSLRLRRGGA